MKYWTPFFIYLEPGTKKGVPGMRYLYQYVTYLYK